MEPAGAKRPRLLAFGTSGSAVRPQAPGTLRPAPPSMPPPGGKGKGGKPSAPLTPASGASRSLAPQAKGRPSPGKQPTSAQASRRLGSGLEAPATPPSFGGTPAPRTPEPEEEEEEWAWEEEDGGVAPPKTPPPDEEEEDDDGWKVAWAGVEAEEEEEELDGHAPPPVWRPKPAEAPKAAAPKAAAPKAAAPKPWESLLEADEGEGAEDPMEEPAPVMEEWDTAEGEDAGEEAPLTPERGNQAPVTPPAAGGAAAATVAEGAGEEAEDEEEEEEEAAEEAAPVESALEQELEDMAKMMEMAESVGNADAAFEFLLAANEQDGVAEGELLDRLQRVLGDLFKASSFGSFVMEPFGSFVTDLGLPGNDGAKRSDMDVVMLFHSSKADIQGNSVRDELVLPTLEKISGWLETQEDLKMTSLVKTARVPIVTFDSEKISVDISIQQPWGVLNSWHLRDLCNSGLPGRLRALVRLVKMWAKSKAIHTAKEGALSSYGYSLLCASFLISRGLLEPLLPGCRGAGRSCYLKSDEALAFVLAKSGGQEAEPLWKEPSEGCEKSAHANKMPAELFADWLEWMDSVVLSFVHLSAGNFDFGCGATPLAQRHVVSVRGRTQSQLLGDLQKWTPKRDHWMPSATNEVYMTIEEPLNGENVARSVRSAGLWAIVKEVGRAKSSITRAGGMDSARFKELLEMPPLARSEPPRQSLGEKRKLPAPFPQLQTGFSGFKRPWEPDSAWQPNKRPHHWDGGQAGYGKDKGKGKGKDKGKFKGKDKGDKGGARPGAYGKPDWGWR